MERKRIVGLIESVRIVDPAVGSGAFPMGALNKLVFILTKVDPENELWKQAQLSAADTIPDPIIKKDTQNQIETFFKERNADYGRKLYLIQKCIYGVDIQQIAVEIAKLRFFISLLVDEKIDKTKNNWGIEPLPNLDFKIMQGNSLISEFLGIDFDNGNETQDKPGQIDLDYKKEDTVLIKQFEQKKIDYQNESDKDMKTKLKGEVEDLMIKIFETIVERQKSYYSIKLESIKSKHSTYYPNEEKRKKTNIEISSYLEKKEKLSKEKGIDLESIEKQLREFTSKNKARPFFPWKLYFAEVFHEKGGFDIVIANPPYVNVEKIEKSIKANIKHFKTAYQKYDLYVLFYERAIDLLKNEGVLTFISSNKFLSQGYGFLLRKQFLQYRIDKIINFNYDIFYSATVRTCIFQLIKTYPHKNDIKIIDINNQSDLYKFNNKIYSYLNQAIFNDTDQNNFRINLTNEKINLIKHIKTNCLKVDDICSVNYGLRPSSEKLGVRKIYFIKMDNQEGIYKKYFEGKDMGYWSIKNHKYIDYRPDIMYNPMFNELFETEKLVGLRTLSDITKLRFIHDSENFYCNDSVVVLTLWYKFTNINYLSITRNITDKRIETSKQYSLQYLQAILNSIIIKFYVNELLYDGTHFYPNHMKQLPIKQCSSDEQKPLIQIVDKILSITKSSDYPNNLAKQMQVKEYEKRIDELVYALYDLTAEEIAIVEGKR
ncbi:type IIS restriction/modification enzyme [Candidatus Magnetoovum chiemensis]|nr:type IIS restriction/modification enzyme [Candidatus Magnetoovum chiemensis]